MKEQSEISAFLDTSDKKQVRRGVRYACHLLGAREYSLKQIDRKLSSKGYSADIIDRICHYLVENGWQSESRYCESFVRSKVAKGQGLNRILFELGQNGIATNLIQEVIAKMDIDWQQVCDKVIQKKIAPGLTVYELKHRQKIEHFLRYRGFNGEEVRSAIGKYMTTTGATTSEHDE